MPSYRASPPRPSLEQIHRLHSYCARFPSEIAEAAIRKYTRRGDSIHDPFCGSGTALAAGMVLGRRVVGGDIDVLAGMLSSVKCTPSSEDAYGRWRARFDKRVERAFSAIERGWSRAATPVPGSILTVGGLRLPLPTFPELNYWFPPQLIALLAAIAVEAHRTTNEHMQQVALVSLSAAIIAKWPNTLSYAMDVDHTRPHRVVQRFTAARVLATYRRRLDRTISCLVSLRNLYQAAGMLSALSDSSLVICPQDAREEAAEIETESQALVITSPPYFNAVDYPRAHRLSVCWMNGRAPEDVASRKQYIGLRHVSSEDGDGWFGERRELRRLVPAAIRSNGRLAKLSGFFADLEAATTQMWRVLRPGGHAVVVIADNTVKGHRVHAHAALAMIAQQAGFELVTRHPREIDTVRRRFPVGTFGFDGPMTHEHVVVLRRPRARRSAKSASANVEPRGK
jgi:DNA modification methylase